MEILEIGAMARVRVTASEKARLVKELHLESTGERYFEVACYKDEGDTMLIPRSHPSVLAEQWLGQGHCGTVDMEMRSELRPKQVPLVNAYIRREGAPFGGILRAPTGTGKTVMGLHIACHYNYPTLIIVPTEAIYNQWVDRIVEHTNVARDDIGFIRQDVCDVRGKKFVLAMVHSLAQRRYREDIYDRFGMVIFDEVHVLGAETFSRTANQFNSILRLGLSATPRRKDGMGKVFLWHIGPIVSSTSVHDVTPRILRLNYYNAALHHRGCFWNGKLQLGRYLNRLAANPARTHFLTGITKSMYDKGHDILVLSDRLNIVHTMRDLLAQEGVTDVGLFTNKEKRLDKKVLLGTYGSAGMGADIPRLSCLVFGTPRVDVVQPIGRVLRDGEPVVVDIVDTASSVMQGWGFARLKYYRRKGYQVTEKDYGQ